MKKKLLRAVKKNVQTVDLMLRCQVFFTHTNNNDKGGRKLREMMGMFIVVTVSSVHTYPKLSRRH